MNLEVIKTAITSKTARQILLAKKHSPKTLFVIGTVGVVGTVVLACRATLKMNDVLEQHENQEIEIRTSVAGKYREKTLSEEDGARETRKLQVKTALTIAKLYAPAVGLGIVSIAALTGSHIVLDKRYNAAMAAYVGLDKAHKEYRRRVISEYGAEADEKLIRGTRDVEVIEKLADGTVKKNVKQAGGEYGGSPYAVLFDEKSKHFVRAPGMNAHILAMKLSYMNDKLRHQGHLFLNEVLDELDLPRTTAGQIVGWVFRSDDEIQKLREQGETVGDNYVSFGIYENDPDLVDQFMTSNNPIWLDFNVDGPIYELI